jgi:hypothetical protein
VLPLFDNTTIYFTRINELNEEVPNEQLIGYEKKCHAVIISKCTEVETQLKKKLENESITISHQQIFSPIVPST